MFSGTGIAGGKMTKFNFEMFYDYYRGCSQREMEAKYNCSNRAITGYCKRVMSYLFNRTDSVIGGNLDQIKSEVNNIIILTGDGNDKN
jgi:hypothetical protein